jgi:hypothetical protein
LQEEEEVLVITLLVVEATAAVAAEVDGLETTVTTLDQGDKMVEDMEVTIHQQRILKEKHFMVEGNLSKETGQEAEAVAGSVAVVEAILEHIMMEGQVVLVIMRCHLQ